MAHVRLERVDNRLSGSLGQQLVDVALDVPNSRAGIRGTYLGRPVDGYWRIESNADSLDPVGLFLGDLGGAPLFLRNEVHLTPHYALRHADLAGSIGDEDLHTRIASVEAPAAGPSVLGIDGEFGGETISVYAAAATDRSGVHVDGLIGERRITLDVTRGLIAGEYSGPDALFLLFACVPLYFL